VVSCASAAGSIMSVSEQIKTTAKQQLKHTLSLPIIHPPGTITRPDSKSEQLG